MRLIDAGALITTMQNYYEYSGRLCDELANIIGNAPTIDAEPVVRCKECDSYDGEECRVHNTAVAPNDYCNYGK